VERLLLADSNYKIFFHQSTTEKHIYSFIYLYIGDIFSHTACAMLTEYPVFSSPNPQMPFAPHKVECAHNQTPILALTRSAQF
jgi:hypothetical protein